MKKKVQGFTIFLLLVCLFAVFSACKEKEGDTTYKISFYNGQKLEKVIEIPKGGRDTVPTVAAAEGYVFERWEFSNGTEFSFDNVTASVSVFAKFKYNAKVQAAVDAVNGLKGTSELGYGDKDAVGAAKNLFEALTTGEKELVDSDRLQAAEERINALGRAIEAVIEAIGALPQATELTYADKDKVDAAQSLLGALPEQSKPYITNASVLEALQEKILALGEAVVSKQVVAPKKTDYLLFQPLDLTGGELRTLLVNGKTVTTELPEAQSKGLVAVTGYHNDQTGTYTIVVADADGIEIGTFSVKVSLPEAVSEVIRAILSLKEDADLTYADKAAVDHARLQYDGLEERYKPFVTNDEKLQAAEARIIALGEAVARFELSAPEKRDYRYGEELDLRGGSILTVLVNGAESSASITIDMVEGYDRYLLGPQDITVTYGDKIVGSFSVTVGLTEAAQAVTDSIAGLKDADMLTYADKDTVQGVREAYDRLSGTDKALIGNYARLQTAEARIDALGLEVVLRTLTPPALREYSYDEALVLTGGLIEETLANGTVTPIALTMEMISGYDRKQIGIQTISVICGDVQVGTFDIEVLVPQAVADVIARIQNLPAEEDLDYDRDRSEVGAARTAYDALSDIHNDYPGMVSADMLQTLQAAEARITALGRRIRSCSIISAPAQTIYPFGGLPVVSGGSVNVVYFDGEEAVLPITEEMLSGFDTQRPQSVVSVLLDGIKAGEFTITVTVPESVQVFNGRVLALPAVEHLDYDVHNPLIRELDAIYLALIEENTNYLLFIPEELREKLTQALFKMDEWGAEIVSYTFSPPFKRDYEIGALLDISDGTIGELRKDGQMNTIPLTLAMCSGYDMSQQGEQTVTVQYAGQTWTYQILVGGSASVDAVIRLIEALPPVENITYDHKTDVIAAFEAMLALSPGQIHFVPAALREKITVAQKKIEAMDAEVLARDFQAPDKTIYALGAEALDLMGGFIRETRRDGGYNTIGLTDGMCSGYDLGMEGEYTVTVSYEGESWTFAITVEGSSMAATVSQWIADINLETLDYADREDIGRIKEAFDGLTPSEQQTISGELRARLDAAVARIRELGEAVVSIYLTFPNIDYTAGVSGLDLTGAVITKTLVNETVVNVDVTLDMIAGSYDLNVPGTYDLTVHYMTEAWPVTVTVEYAQAVLDVIGFIEDLPDPLAYSDKREVDDAWQAYTNLSDEDKRAFPEETLHILQEANIRIEELGLEIVGHLLQPPQKISYYAGDSELDLTGGFVVLSLRNGSEQSIPLEPHMLSAFDLTSPGESTITVTYADRTIGTFGITVAYAPAVLAIMDALEQLPQTLIYDVHAVAVNGLAVSYSNLRKGEQDTFPSLHKQMLSAAVAQIETLGGIVRSRALSEPRTLYQIGETALDLTEGCIVETLFNGQQREIPVTESMLGSYDLGEVGSQTIHVTYEDWSASFTIEVTYSSDMQQIIDAVSGFPVPLEYTHAELVHDTNQAYERLTTLEKDNFPAEYKTRLDEAVETIALLGMVVVGKGITPPDQTFYAVEDTQLHLAGGYVHEYLRNGSVRNIPMTEEMLEGYDFEGVGEQTVTVTYAGEVFGTFVIVMGYTQAVLRVMDLVEQLPLTESLNYELHHTQVSAAKTAFDALSDNDELLVPEATKSKLDAAVQRMEELAVTVDRRVLTPPDKLVYEYGEGLSLMGSKIVEILGNGTSREVTVTEAMLSAYSMTQVGTQTVTVTYTGALVGSFVIEVLRPQALDDFIELVDGLPSVDLFVYETHKDAVIAANNAYLALAIPIRNLVPAATMNKLNALMEKLNEEGDAVPVSIELLTLPDKTVYYYGENIDLSGATLKVNFSDGTHTILHLSGVQGNGVKSDYRRDALGNDKIVTLTYNNNSSLTTTFTASTVLNTTITAVAGYGDAAFSTSNFSIKYDRLHGPLLYRDADPEKPGMTVAGHYVGLYLQLRSIAGTTIQIDSGLAMTAESLNPDEQNIIEYYFLIDEYKKSYTFRVRYTSPTANESFSLDAVALPLESIVSPTVESVQGDGEVQFEITDPGNPYALTMKSGLLSYVQDGKYYISIVLDIYFADIEVWANGEKLVVYEYAQNNSKGFFNFLKHKDDMSPATFSVLVDGRYTVEYILTIGEGMVKQPW